MAAKNFASGLLDGYNILSSIKDRQQKNQRFQTLAEREDAQYAQQVQDQNRLRDWQIEDRETNQELQAEQLANSREDRHFMRQDRATNQSIQAEALANSREDRATDAEQREYEKSLRPFERDALRMQASGRYTQEQINQVNLRNAKRVERSEEMRSIIDAAQSYMRTGDMAGARAEHSKLSQYGFDMKGIESDKEFNTEQVLDRLMEGEIDLESEDTMAMVRRIMGPSMELSGRAASGLTPTGRLVEVNYDAEGNELPEPLFNVEMKDANGKVVPRTLGYSSDENDKSLSMLTVEDLMSSAHSQIMIEQQIMQSNLMAANAQIGRQPVDNLERRETEADIAYTEARTDEIRNKIGGVGPEKELQSLKKSFEYSDPDAAAVLETLQHTQSFDLHTAPTQVDEIIALAESEGVTLERAVGMYDTQYQIAQQVPMHTAELMNKHPDIDPLVANELIERQLAGEITAKDVAKRVAELEESAARKKKIAETNKSSGNHSYNRRIGRGQTTTHLNSLKDSDSAPETTTDAGPPPARGLFNRALEDYLTQGL